MKFYRKAESAASRILDAFQADNVPKALAPVFVRRRDNVPCRAWSWNNQLLVALAGHADAREGAALGKYRHGAGIALGVKNASTWAHELVHAADDRLGHLTERGQHWRSETVAELGGAILLEILGHEVESDRGGCWDYVQAYARDAGIEPVTACLRVLKRCCEAVALILDTAENMREGVTAAVGSDAV